MPTRRPTWTAGTPCWRTRTCHVQSAPWLGSPAARVVSSTGVRARVTPAGERSKGPVKLDKVIAQLQDQPDAVQHWTVDQAGLDDLVARLSTKPGIHAVHLSADEKAPATAAKPESQLG